MARRVADIGGGTGVLAMAAARLWPARAVAGDIDPLATLTARENVAANGVGGRVACVTAAGFRHPRLRRGRALRPDLREHPRRAAAGGWRRSWRGRRRRAASPILSGILARQAAGVLATYRGWGYRRRGVVAIGEWRTLVLRALSLSGRARARRRRRG